MGQDTRDIVRAASDRESASGKDLVAAIRARFEPLGGVEVELPPRQPISDCVTFRETSREPLDTRP